MSAHVPQYMQGLQQQPLQQHLPPQLVMSQHDREQQLQQQQQFQEQQQLQQHLQQQQQQSLQQFMATAAAAGGNDNMAAPPALQHANEDGDFHQFLMETSTMFVGPDHGLTPASAELGQPLQVLTDQQAPGLPAGMLGSLDMQFSGRQGQAPPAVAAGGPGGLGACAAFAGLMPGSCQATAALQTAIGATAAAGATAIAGQAAAPFTSPLGPTAGGSVVPRSALPAAGTAATGRHASPLSASAAAAVAGGHGVGRVGFGTGGVGAAPGVMQSLPNTATAAAAAACLGTPGSNASPPAAAGAEVKQSAYSGLPAAAKLEEAARIVRDCKRVLAAVAAGGGTPLSQRTPLVKPTILDQIERSLRDYKLAQYQMSMANSVSAATAWKATARNQVLQVTLRGLEVLCVTLLKELSAIEAGLRKRATAVAGVHGSGAVGAVGSGAGVVGGQGVHLGGPSGGGGVPSIGSMPAVPFSPTAAGAAAAAAAAAGEAETTAGASADQEGSGSGDGSDVVWEYGLKLLHAAFDGCAMTARVAGLIERGVAMVGGDLDRICMECQSQRQKLSRGGDATKVIKSLCTLVPRVLEMLEQCRSLLRPVLKILLTDVARAEQRLDMLGRMKEKYQEKQQQPDQQQQQDLQSRLDQVRHGLEETSTTRMLFYASEEAARVAMMPLHLAGCHILYVCSLEPWLQVQMSSFARPPSAAAAAGRGADVPPGRAHGHQGVAAQAAAADVQGKAGDELEAGVEVKPALTGVTGVSGMDDSPWLLQLLFSAYSGEAEVEQGRVQLLLSLLGEGAVAMDEDVRHVRLPWSWVMLLSGMAQLDAEVLESMLQKGKDLKLSQSNAAKEGGGMSGVGSSLQAGGSSSSRAVVPAEVEITSSSASATASSFTVWGKEVDTAVGVEGVEEASCSTAAAAFATAAAQSLTSGPRTVARQTGLTEQCLAAALHCGRKNVGPVLFKKMGSGQLFRCSTKDLTVPGYLVFSAVIGTEMNFKVCKVLM